MCSFVYFSEQPQVAVGLGAGGLGIPTCLNTKHLSAQPVCTCHREAPTRFGEKRGHSVGIPASSAAITLPSVAKEALPCPMSASGERRVEG